MTFALDGGTIRGKEVTAYTVCISFDALKMGRTDLTPIAYAFSGEKHVD